MFLPNSLFTPNVGKIHMQAERPQFLRNYWSLTGVPYCFNTGFCPKFWEIVVRKVKNIILHRDIFPLLIFLIVVNISVFTSNQLSDMIVD